MSSIKQLYHQRMSRPVASLNLPEFKIRQLHSKGYLYVDDINLETIKSDINLTAEEWKNLTEIVETKTALDLCEAETISRRIVTFSSELDAILGGGIPFKMITELTGQPGSGKTQLCLQLSVSIQVPDCFGGNNGEAVFIDTSLGFHPYRLAEMARGCIQYCQNVATTYNSFEMFETLKTLTEDTFLKGVHYIKAVKFTELLASVHILKKYLHQNKNIKLVIIDNITEPVKSISSDCTDLDYFERIKSIYSYLLELEKLAQKFNFAIVLTNDMTIKFNEDGSSYETPCLGDSFAHRINTRIKLKRKSDSIFCATVIKNVSRPISSARFQIVESGIRDIN